VGVFDLPATIQVAAHPCDAPQELAMEVVTRSERFIKEQKRPRGRQESKAGGEDPLKLTIRLLLGSCDRVRDLQ
jgi:hypothetical protein